MKKKLRVDEKLHSELGIKVENRKFEEAFMRVNKLDNILRMMTSNSLMKMIRVSTSIFFKVASIRFSSPSSLL